MVIISNTEIEVLSSGNGYLVKVFIEEDNSSVLTGIDQSNSFKRLHVDHMELL